MKHPLIDTCIMCSNGDFKKYPNTPSKIPVHYYCTKCHTVYNSSFEFPPFQKYETLNSEQCKRMLQADLKHYNRLLAEHFKTKAFFTASYDEVHAFGGGFPKLESFFTHDTLHVYDGCADGYCEIIDIFKPMYNYNKPIDYIKYVFDDTNDFLAFMHKSVDKTSRDMITFVNFLEHLHPALLVKTLEALRAFNKTVENKTYLIHVPWTDLSRKSSWVHWHEEHFIYIPLTTYTDYLSRLGFNIIWSVKNYDDSIIVFE